MGEGAAVWTMPASLGRGAGKVFSVSCVCREQREWDSRNSGKKRMIELDRHDVLLLAELQRDSRQTVQQLASAAGLSSTPCWKRVKEMEAAGVIRGYTALVDRELVGLSLCVLA